MASGRFGKLGFFARPNGPVFGPDGQQLTKEAESKAAVEFAVRLGEALSKEAEKSKQLVKEWEREEWWKAWMLQGSLHTSAATEKKASRRRGKRADMDQGHAASDHSLSKREFRQALRSVLRLKGSDADALAKLDTGKHQRSKAGPCHAPWAPPLLLLQASLCSLRSPLPLTSRA